MYRRDRQGRLQAIKGLRGFSILCLPPRRSSACSTRTPSGRLRSRTPFSLLALLRGGPFSRLEVRSRSLYAALLFLSPVTAFVLWPHPEVFSCSLVVLALALWREGSGSLAVLMAALASVQNPPLVLLAAFLWWEARRAGGGLGPTLALLPALWPFAFHLLRFGRLTLLTEVGAVALHDVSPRRALELFFDLNLGLLPYVPFVLLGALAAPFLQIVSHRPARALLALWAVLLGMAVSCTANANWNHGTAGPSRYSIWLLPLVLEVFIRMLEPGFASPRVRTTFLVLTALAVATQATLLAYQGGIAPAPDHLEHSYAARFVLRHAPDLYNPSPEIFVERTLGREIRGDEVPDGAPVVLRDESRCYKVLTQKRYWPEVLARCGCPRDMPDFQHLARERRRNEWIYVNFGAPPPYGDAACGAP